METTPAISELKIMGFVNLRLILTFLPIMTSGYDNILLHHLCSSDFTNVYSGKIYINLGKESEPPITFQKAYI